MTVSELIEKLKEMPGELPVLVHDGSVYETSLSEPEPRLSLFTHSAVHGFTIESNRPGVGQPAVIL